MNSFLLSVVLAVVAGVIYTVIAAAITGQLAPKRRVIVIAAIAVFAVIGFVVAKVVEQPTASVDNSRRPPPLGSGAEQGPGESAKKPAIDRPRPPFSSKETFVRKYVVGSARGQSRRPLWTVLIPDEGAVTFPELRAAATGAVSDVGYENAAIFRPSVALDSNFEQYFADPSVLRSLHGYCDGVVIGKAESVVRENNDLGNMFTADLAVEMRLISTQTGGAVTEFRLRQNGAGFTRNEAQAQAEARLAPELKARLKEELQRHRP
jgi:hypothetical protein